MTDPDAVNWMESNAAKQHHSAHTDTRSTLFKGTSAKKGVIPPPPPAGLAAIIAALDGADHDATGQPFITAFDVDVHLPQRDLDKSVAHFNCALAARVEAHAHDDVGALRETVREAHACHGPLAFVSPGAQTNGDTMGEKVSPDKASLDWRGTLHAKPDAKSVFDSREADHGCHEMRDMTEDGRHALVSDGNEEHVIDPLRMDALMSKADDTTQRLLVTHDEQLKRMGVDSKALDALDCADIKITKQEAVPLPSSFDKAVNGPWKECWKKALHEEQSSFVPDVTHKVVPLTEWRGKVIRMHIVIDRRHHPASGAIKSLKRRIVVNGQSMAKGTDHELACAGAPNSHAVRSLDCLRVKRSMIAMQSDVSCAFLAGDLEPGQVGRLAVRPPKHPQTCTADGMPEIWTLLKRCMVSSTHLDVGKPASTISRWGSEKMTHSCSLSPSCAVNATARFITLTRTACSTMHSMLTSAMSWQPSMARMV